MGLLITFFLGIFIIIGAFIVRSAKRRRIIEQLSVSVAFGTMAALAALELLPESLESLGDNLFLAAAAAFAGLLLLKVLDRFIPKHYHSHGNHSAPTEENVIHIGIISSIAVIAHNIIEGMAVYSIAAESVKAGFLMALSIGFHNIPMGMVIYSTLRRENRRVKIALLSASALSTLAGGFLMSSLWYLIDELVIGTLVSLTLGMIIYILCFELTPHILRSPNKKLSLAGIAVGAALIIAGCFFE